MVNCTVSDDQNQTASSSASVNVQAPQSAPEASKLNECDFPNTRLPGRVDNTCKAKLDDVAQALRNDPNARAVIVGHATTDEIGTTGNANLAAHRAYNSKLYLTQGEAQLNIDPSRIEVRTGAADSQKAENYIVPAGGNFRVAGTTPVDESRIKAPEPTRRHTRETPAKPAQ
jgi:outer membrane protein OmpA-like peptidoglycan-associated protein